jgi:small subunit ribosomal protein S6
MLRTYETIYVTTPDSGEDKLTAINAKLKEFITGAGAGEVGQDDNWGIRDLAYKINKQSKGRYHYLAYNAKPAVIKEIEFFLKISESVIRYITVKVSDVPTLDKMRKPDPKNLGY